jgi:hypothetical protein
MNNLSTLLLAAQYPALTVLCPAGIGRLTNLRLGKAPLATVTFEDRTKCQVSTDLVRPILKGFVLLRAEAMSGKGVIVDRLLSQVMPIVAAHTLIGVFKLPINYDMTRPTIEAPLDFNGNELVAPGNFGRIRVTEDLRIFWQPTNDFNKATPGNEDIDAVDLGWVPLHCVELTNWLLSQGYAAEIPLNEYLTPVAAELMRNDPAVRRAFFYGGTNLN